MNAIDNVCVMNSMRTQGGAGNGSSESKKHHFHQTAHKLPSNIETLPNTWAAKRQPSSELNTKHNYSTENQSWWWRTVVFVSAPAGSSCRSLPRVSESHSYCHVLPGRP